MLLPVLSLRQEKHVVCQRVRKVHQFLGFHVSLQCFVHSGGSSFAGLHPVVYKAWVTLVCLPTHFSSFCFVKYGNKISHACKVSSLSGIYVYRVQGALRRICKQKHCKTSFSPSRVFLFSQNSRVRFWGLILWLLYPGPTPFLQRVGIEVFNVGGWLTHG